MTETVSGAGAEATQQTQGLAIERVFSTEGVHPYDELTWERRDVVQTNWKSGEIVIDPSEIADARFFRKDDLPLIPPPLSIARTLIDVAVGRRG